MRNYEYGALFHQGNEFRSNYYPSIKRQSRPVAWEGTDVAHKVTTAPPPSIQGSQQVQQKMRRSNLLHTHCEAHCSNAWPIEHIDNSAILCTQRCITGRSRTREAYLKASRAVPPPRANNPHSRGGSGAASRAGCEKSLSELSSAPQPLVSSKTPELRHMTGLTIPHLAVVVGDFL